MNKKLLLSFAVFATALTVNAQKRGEFKKAPVRQPNIVELNSTDVISKFNTNEKPSSIRLDKKRGSINVVDTSLYFSSKKTYASPKSSNIQLVAYPSQSGDSTELATVYQIIPNNSNITLNGIKMSMVSLNKAAGSCDVDVKVYNQNTGATLAKATKNILYSSSSFSSYNFIFDKPLVTNSDILVSIEPSTENDSLLLPTSGAYRNSSITCNVTDDKLTIVSGGSNIGTSFWYGQEVTGAGIPANTYVIGFDGTTYTLSNSVSSPLSNALLSGVNLTFDDVKYNAGYMYLKFPTVSGSNTVPDFTKAPKQTNDALIWLNLGTSQNPNWKYFDANLSIYPLVSYSFESTPVATKKCLGDDKNVDISYSNQDAFNIAKNPLLSKIAFNSKYLSKNKRSGNYFSDAYSLNDSQLADTLDINSSSMTYQFVEKSADMNDTIVVTDYIWTYGYNVPGKLLYVTSNILISSAINSTATISEAIKCNGGEAKVNVASTLGGFAPYTGEGEQTGVKAGSRDFTVTDANGCTGVANIVVTEPTAIDPVATVTDAKCSGDKVKVEITATGGTGAYTGLVTEEVAAVAGEKSYDVTDANSCKATVKATIKDAPSAIALDSNAVKASNDVTADGKAIVIATGGTAPYSYTWVGNNSTNDTIVVGKGSYKVTVKDANDCATFATITVGAGTASVADLAIKGLAIYPNPVASQLFVSFNANSAATVELLNVAGQVIESRNATNVVNTSFNTEKLTSGVYFVSIKVAEGTFTQKVIKD